MGKHHAALLAMLPALLVFAIFPSRSCAGNALGTVAALIVGPDGVPVRNHDVILKPITLRLFNRASDDTDTVAYSGRTDASGHLSVQIPLGLFLAQIIVPGVGFGATGVIDVEPNTTLLMTLPRLAPFATISGTVAPALIKPGAHVAFDSAFGSRPSSALIDAQGRFTLTDVWPGTVHLIIPEEIPAGVPPNYGYAESEVINVHPGEQFTGIHVTAPDSLALLPPPPTPTATVTKGPTITGTVMDTAGKPVPNVTVYAFISCESIIDGGGHGRKQSVRTDVTDANGKYALNDLPTGEPEFPGTDVSLIAVKPDTVPSVTTAHLMPDDTAGAKNPNDNQTINLVISNQSPVLEIQVMQDGKPVTGARVQLSPHPGSLLNDAQYIIGFISADAPNPLDSLFHPSMTTGSDGVATFRALAPGLWDVTASSYPLGSATAEPRDIPFPHEQLTATNTSIGVVVRADRINRYTLKLFYWTKPVPVHVAMPTSLAKTDTQWISAETTSMAGRKADASAFLDSTRSGMLNLTAPGLWRIETSFPRVPSDGTKVSDFNYQSDSVIAYAPDVWRLSPVVQTTRIEPDNDLGSIRVKLRDRRGRPVMGSVLVYTLQNDLIAAGATDTRGEILFSDISAGYYHLTKSLLSSRPLPILGNDTAPMPDDSALTGYAVLLPEGAAERSDQLFGPSVSVEAGQEADVVYRLHPVGYIKGRLLAPPGDTFSDCQFDGASATGQIPPLQLLKTGEFVSGPYVEGKADFKIVRNTHGVYGEAVTGPASRATVSSRHVTRVNVRTIPPSPSQIRAAVDQNREQEGEKPLNGLVFLADGKTPAWAACALIVRSTIWSETQSAATDALGHLSNNGSFGGEPIDTSETVPKRPVIVAYLPGECGAVIAPYMANQPVCLTLPPPMSLHGRITVGGQSVTGLDSTFRIRAACQGRGSLNDILSVEAAAQADGTFELAGLTPGVYQIQAARDDVWLSQTQTITVKRSDPPDSLIDIGLPGATIVLHLRDAAGKPIVKQTVTLMRSPGPLTELLWPKTLTTDGAGDVRIEGMEAGRQAVSINPSRSSRNADYDDSRSQLVSFMVPPYVTGEQAVEKTVILTSE